MAVMRRSSRTSSQSLTESSELVANHVWFAVRLEIIQAKCWFVCNSEYEHPRHSVMSKVSQQLKFLCRIKMKFFWRSKMET
jgi:hypothetical protein